MQTYGKAPQRTPTQAPGRKSGLIGRVMSKPGPAKRPSPQQKKVQY